MRAKDITVPGQVEILNGDQYIATITDKNTELKIEMAVETGLGYVPKEELQKERIEIGTIALDAIFTPIRRVNYEVENMRVGDRTDFNKLRISLVTDGTITPREALEESIRIMINQLKAIVGFVEKEEIKTISKIKGDEENKKRDIKSGEVDQEFLKTRIETLELSARTTNALSNANIRTVGGLTRKSEDDLSEIDGLGNKGIQEIKKTLGNYGITLKD